MGGSVGCADWSRVDGAVDISPRGIWIDYIRPGLEDGKLIDWVTCLLYFVQLPGRLLYCWIYFELNILWYGLGLACWISGVATVDRRVLDHGCERFLGGG